MFVSRSCAKPRRGASLVEFAIVLVLLITIVLGCVDFGRFALALIAVNNAAREGASFGGTHPHTPGTQALWESRIQETVRQEMTGIPSFREDDLTIQSPTLVADSQPPRVRVEIGYTFQTIIPWPVFPRRIDMTRAAEMPFIR